MTLPPIFAHLVAGLLLLIVFLATAAAGYVIVRAIRSTSGVESLPGHAPQMLLFAFFLGLLAAGVFGVGKAMELLTDGAPAVIGIGGTFFGGWLGYKVFKAKKGDHEVSTELERP